MAERERESGPSREYIRRSENGFVEWAIVGGVVVVVVAALTLQRSSPAGRVGKNASAEAHTRRDRRREGDCSLNLQNCTPST